MTGVAAQLDREWLQAVDLDNERDARKSNHKSETKGRAL